MSMRGISKHAKMLVWYWGRYSSMPIPQPRAQNLMNVPYCTCQCCDEIADEPDSGAFLDQCDMPQETCQKMPDGNFDAPNP